MGAVTNSAVDVTHLHTKLGTCGFQFVISIFKKSEEMDYWVLAETILQKFNHIETYI